jgi:hypothetical protein
MQTSKQIAVVGSGLVGSLWLFTRKAGIPFIFMTEVLILDKYNFQDALLI